MSGRARCQTRTRRSWNRIMRLRRMRRYAPDEERYKRWRKRHYERINAVRPLLDGASRQNARAAGNGVMVKTPRTLSRQQTVRVDAAVRYGVAAANGSGGGGVSGDGISCAVGEARHAASAYRIQRHNGTRTQMCSECV